MAGDSVNMAVYPCRLPEQSRELLDLAEADYKERGGTEPFDREAYLKEAEALLKEHPNYIALSYLKGKLTGFTRIGYDENLPKTCGLMERVYIIPELQGKGYGMQLFGYCAHELRYGGFTELAMAREHTPEEDAIAERFVFHRMNGLPEYLELALFSPTIPCHLMA